MKRRNKESKNFFQKFIIVCFILLLLLVIAIVIYKVIVRKNIGSHINNEVVIEYGETVILNDILKTSDVENIRVVPELDTLKEVGDYAIKVTLNNETFDVKVSIKDTVSPNLEVQDVTKYIDEELPDVNDFIVFSSDLSEYEIVPVVLEKNLGTVDVEIVARDKYGNETKKNAKFTLIEDSEPPVFSGLSSISIEEGTRIDLTEGVSAVDSRYGDAEFTFDDSNVYYNTPGEYVITYYAKDPLGNETIANRNITITAKPIVYMINNFPVYNQYPNYPNGCESIALYNLLRYYGINITPEEIVERLKKGDGPYWNGNTLYGGNPEIEFVGDPRDIHGYGVYQRPILDVANTYKSGMIDYNGHSLNEVLELVKQQIPVQVWVSINLKDTDVCARWTYVPTGETISWICNLHSVVIVGYTDSSIFVSDSYTGKIEEYNRAQFEKMYNLFGKRALYYPN